MKKWKVYPLGYDPAIADGPPSSVYLKAGCNWTEEDTKQHKKMEKDFIIFEGEKPPVGRWSKEII